MPYDVETMKAPLATGSLLRLLCWLAENPLTGGVLSAKLLEDAGLTLVRKVETDEDLPVRPDLPEATDPGFSRCEPGTRCDPPELPEPAAPGFRFAGIRDYERRYREGTADPVRVAESLLETVAGWERGSPPMRLFIAQDPEDIASQAEASRARWEAGAPLGPLDGVPVAIKDEMDQAGYPTTLGTGFRGKGATATEDSEPVARLRGAGALLVGKTNMHEIGIGVSGINPHHGTPRNPYGPAHWTGGSSSGSAAAVGSNLVPLALGADGGGSIRVPAALCGVVGLKATWGRVSERGVPALCWSVGHAGPIGASVGDVALAYALIAGPDGADWRTLCQPAPTVAGWDDPDLRGVRVGVYRAWFEDAHPEVISASDHGVAALVAAGAELVEVEVPELAMLRAAHLVTIISEMAASQQAQLDRDPRVYGAETRLNLALGRQLRADDYVQAQRHRVRITGHFKRALRDVDVLATPSTGVTAPVIRPSALAHGISDLETGDRVMRFAPAGNLTGLPAISVPTGYDSAGLPVGLQLMGRAWGERRLLQLAAVVEAATERRAPVVVADLLGQSAP